MLALIVYLAFLSGGNGDGDDNGDVVQGSPTATVTPSPAPEDSVTPTPDGGAAEATTTVASGEVTAVATGGGHSCAITDVGSLKCWGSNRSGQLGDGSTTDSEAPVYVCATGAGPPCTPENGNVLRDVTAISVGDAHTCALTFEGGVKCWGSNTAGELGDGTKTNRTTSVDVMGLESGVKAIAAGGGGTWGGYTCAVTTAGGLKCWGNNRSGQLGDNTTTNREAPVDVPGLTSGVKAVATGVTHTCAVTTDDGLKCWGSNGLGQLGNGTKTRSYTPVDVADLSSGVAAVALGERHTCALTTAGGVTCWGNGTRGQLGDGNANTSYTHVDVLGLTNGVDAVAAGTDHACAVTTAGAVKCWGWNSTGQLGNGTTDTSTAPVVVADLGAGVTAISTWGNLTCAVTTAGGVTCWGDGQLTPLEVLGLD